MLIISLFFIKGRNASANERVKTVCLTRSLAVAFLLFKYFQFEMKIFETFSTKLELNRV